MQRRVVSVHPYRIPYPDGPSPERTFEPSDLRVVATVIWAASLLRLVVGAVHAEPIGFELVLAALLALAFPRVIKKT